MLRFRVEKRKDGKERTGGRLFSKAEIIFRGRSIVFYPLHYWIYIFIQQDLFRIAIFRYFRKFPTNYEVCIKFPNRVIEKKKHRRFTPKESETGITALMRFEETEAPIGQKFSSGSFEFHARPSFHCSRLPSSAISRHTIMEPEFSSPLSWTTVSTCVTHHRYNFSKARKPRNELSPEFRNPNGKQLDETWREKRPSLFPRDAISFEFRADQGEGRCAEGRSRKSTNRRISS